MSDAPTTSLFGSLSDTIAKGATKWSIFFGACWALTGVAKSILTGHYVDSLDSLGYLFLILGIAGVRHSVVSTAAEAAVSRAEIAGAPVAKSQDPAVQREIVKIRETQ